jgi:nitric oxide dioxygenase
MLSDSARPIIEATLPVVGENIQEIAKRFYEHMFAENPQLMDGVFNRGNQAAGRQQQALAGSVAAFAGYLVQHPDQLPDALISRISHKHASLGIHPDQYQIVHDNLMWAIGDVLGDAVTPEIAHAWDEVYWLFANVLINMERGFYEDLGLSPETVWRTWRVVEKVPETADVVRFVVERLDDREVKPSLPGQYVTLQMPTVDGLRQPRQYSLIKADDGHHRQFAVKRVHGLGTPDGEVSTLLHWSVNVGDEVVLSAPFGDVVLDRHEDRPIVLASAGIGITPMAGMLSHLAKSGSDRQIMVLHADNSADSFALRSQIEADLATLPNGSMVTWFAEASEETQMADGELVGFMDVSKVNVPENAAVYLCGPLVFMQAVRSDLIAAGVPVKDIQYEVFGPDLWQADYQ